LDFSLLALRFGFSPLGSIRSFRQQPVLRPALVTPAGISAGSVAPSRVALSCALVFQSERRKRSAAVRYHLPASAGISDGFQIARQFERDHRVASFGEKIRQLCPGVFFRCVLCGFARLICFQSAIQ